jgi:4'-phosphopantetheinyl transferase
VITAFITEVVERLSANVFHSYLLLLDEHDQTKIKRFINWRDAHLSLFGRLLLIEGLTQQGYGPDKVKRIDHTHYHRPFFKDGPDFSISHAGRFVICVIADEKVGIDIEEIRPIDIGNFKSQWTEAEWKRIMEDCEPLRQFYRYWTRKEAIIKADGRGMRLPLHTFDVSATPVRIDDDAWFLTEINLNDGYCCSLARKKNSEDPIEKEFRSFYTSPGQIIPDPFNDHECDDSIPVEQP